MENRFSRQNGTYQELLLGDVNIGKHVSPILAEKIYSNKSTEEKTTYLKKKIKIEKENKNLSLEANNLKRTLEKLEKDNLPSEQLFADQLKTTLKKMNIELNNSSKMHDEKYAAIRDHMLISTKYSPIDLSFLEMSSKINLGSEYFIDVSLYFKNKWNFFKEIVSGRNRISIPKFAVFEYARLSRMCLDFSKDFYYNEVTLSFNFDDGNSETKRSIPPIFSEHFAEIYAGMGSKPQMTYKKESTFIEYNGIFALGVPHNRSVFTEFNGLIPSEVKENVKKSLKYFDKDNIYLIKETKPEEWNVEKFITKDPLVVGVKNNQAYLIDHFDTTNLENLVKDTYTNFN